MKEKLIELLKQCQKECDETSCEQCIYDASSDCGTHHIADFLIAHGATVSNPNKEGKDRTASLNYEAEYHKLIEEKECLMAKMEFLRSEHNSLETEFIRLRAQMDVVQLIFGGK